MKTSVRLLLIALLVAACIASESLAAGDWGPTEDGWHTWQVAAADGGELQIYVSMERGRPVKLRLQGDSICSGHFDVEATDLGFVEVDQSIDWLRRYTEPQSELGSEVLMAISFHSGDRPVTILADVVKSGSNRKLREEALFWLAQSDSDDAFVVIDRLLSGKM